MLLVIYMTMSRDIKHTKSATQATQHTENTNPIQKKILTIEYKV